MLAYVHMVVTRAVQVKDLPMSLLGTSLDSG